MAEANHRIKSGFLPFSTAKTGQKRLKTEKNRN
jgi:hypothetical protein